MKNTGPFCCFRNAVPTITVYGVDFSLYGHYICGHGITTNFEWSGECVWNMQIKCVRVTDTPRDLRF